LNQRIVDEVAEPHVRGLVRDHVGAIEHLVLRRRFVEEQARRVVEDGARVLHAAEGEGGNRHDVELAEGVRDGRVVFEPGQGDACRSKMASRLRATLAASVSRWNRRNCRPPRSAVSTENRPAGERKEISVGSGCVSANTSVVVPVSARGIGVLSRRRCSRLPAGGNRGASASSAPSDSG
jgi:hypothetical protein